ncbi:MAG TPA: glycosyltransferase family 4 protein [Solirubrobacterales bacterium]|nr:glycosyltransferase family 4 protein [Solirubrobacterales bacterium]
MRIGIVTKWFNRGQAFVSRYIRDALDARGHETFILARPTRDKGPMAAHVDRTGVWDQPGVTEASDWEVPFGEYERWIADNRLEAVHWDNCYQHEEIARIRGSGVRTVGRFVWEMFGADDAGPAGRAYDVLYSLTRCEQQRYAELGIESPYVRWGLHPELLEVASQAQQAASSEQQAADGLVRFYFPGALLGPRKPHKEVVEAFTNAEGDNLRLIFKAQLERRMGYLEKAAAADPRIELVIDDMPTDEHLRLFASCDVCLGPSRWEGLGLFLYEAVAFGMPQISNDSAPMNEVVVDGVNGLLVGDERDGDAPSGIPSMRPDVAALTDAIERLADPGLRGLLAQGARSSRDEHAWERTVDDYAELFAGLES